MSEPQYDQHDADVYYLMQEKRAAEKQRDQLRSALVGLVGVDGRADLEQMEAMMRMVPQPAQDRAATIDAVHALIATLPEGA
jgi:hypothetical protein